MIKFLITPERFAEACNVIEYVNTQAETKETIVRIAPRFMVNADGEYLVKVNLDDDGDITSYEGYDKAFMSMAAITPKRLERLIVEFSEAARAIVNPPNGKA